MIAGKTGIGKLNYVYFKDGSKLSDLLANLNSGIVFYRKDNFNLAKLVDYLEKIDLANEKNFHFIEQAGYAFSLMNLVGLPSDQYSIVDPVNENTIVRHYTSPKRPLFYIEGLEILKKEILN